jgi:hypothetical protein
VDLSKRGRLLLEQFAELATHRARFVTREGINVISDNGSAEIPAAQA